MADRSPPKRSIAGIAGIVAVATALSKASGLLREVAIAAAFGVGPVVNAYAYAYIIPGFLLILLGGINGPFHSALVSVLSRRDRAQAAPLVESVTTLVSLLLLVVVVVLIAFADAFIDLVAPGLSADPERAQVRAIAVQQLRIMAPMALLAGLIGIGFGTLNAANRYWLPSISPLFSNLAIGLGLGGLAFVLGEQVAEPEYARLGGMVLAGGTLAGAFWQWLMQAIAQWRAGLGKLRPRLNWRHSGVREVLRIMGPAALSAGMLQINVYTDMFFASYISHAAAAMKYANLIVLTPLGILSNAILVPLLPVFSRLAAPENWGELKTRIRQGLLLTALTMLPLSAVFVVLAEPVVGIVYQRYAFDAQALAIVAPVMAAYGLGMFFYLGRDVLVRVFYALGDGTTPFRISAANIGVNAALDYGLVQVLETSGLVLATLGVNLISMGLLLAVLHRKIGGLPLLAWGRLLLALAGSALAAGLVGGAVRWGWASQLGSDGLGLQLVQLATGSTAILAVFVVLAKRLGLPELAQLEARLRQRLSRGH